MGKKTKTKTATCYLCGKEKVTTQDHVPQKSLSPNSPRRSFFFAPACEGCNEKYSIDESRFRDFVVSGGAHWGNRSADEAFETMKRGFKRNQLGLYLTGKANKDLMRIITNMRKVNIVTPGGIYLGKAAQLVVPKDLDYVRVLTKIARGLHFVNTKTVVPSNYVMNALFLKALDPVKNIFDLCNIKGTCGDFFSFKGGVPKDDPLSSVWFMFFYGRIAAIAWLLKPKVAKSLVSSED